MRLGLFNLKIVKELLKYLQLYIHLQREYKIKRTNIKINKTMVEEISVRKCCCLCDNLYNNEKCPLFSVYNSAGYYGDETFDESAKYRVVCDEFVLSKKFNE